MLATERNVQFEVICGDGSEYDEEEEGCELAFYDLPGILVQSTSMQEAVSNVIDNAFKYVELRDNNVHPSIRVYLLPNNSDKETGQNTGVTILVQDNGPGIPNEYHESVFQRGFRSHLTKDMVDGNGIGLDISKSFIEQMGGSLEIVDNHRVGAVLGKGKNLQGNDNDEMGGEKGTIMKMIFYQNPLMEEIGSKK